MFEIFTIFLVYLISLNIAAFIGVMILATFFQIKKRNFNPTQEKWQVYLQKIGPKGIVQRLHVSYMLALGILAVINYNLAFHHSIAYTITLLIYRNFPFVFQISIKQKQLTQAL